MTLTDSHRRTSAVRRQILPQTPAEQISWAQMVLSTARSAQWPESGGKRIAEVMEDLWLALEMADALDAGKVHPAAEYPELEDEPRAKQLAMTRAAEEVREWAAELIRLFPAAALN
jgi:hypothetical protein